MDKDCSSVSPAALYGCGTGGDGAPLRSLGDFGTVAGVEFGVCHILTRATRVEVLVEYRPRFAFDGRANFLEPTRQQSVSADLSTLSGMLAAYVDLPELGVPRLGRFSPFLGGGAGAVRVEIGETRMAFPRTTTIVPGARRVNLAWMLTAGVATSLDDDTTLELAWRYADLGPVETGEGRGRVVWRDGCPSHLFHLSQKSWNFHHHRIPFPACIRSSKSSRAAQRFTQKSLPSASRWLS